jgi:hypothetical protein
VVVRRAVGVAARVAFGGAPVLVVAAPGAPG